MYIHTSIQVVAPRDMTINWTRSSVASLPMSAARAREVELYDLNAGANVVGAVSTGMPVSESNDPCTDSIDAQDSDSDNLGGSFSRSDSSASFALECRCPALVISLMLAWSLCDFVILPSRSLPLARILALRAAR